MHVSRTQRPTTVAPPEWVSGTAWIDEIAVPEGPSRLKADSVHFAPGARTAWHRHPRGQVLYVTEGTGLVQRRGGEVHTLRAGDRVRIEPGEWHWHGASPSTFMTHLAVQEVAEDGTEAERGPHVTEAEHPGRPAAPRAH